jgi:hypothetical protein
VSDQSELHERLARIEDVEEIRALVDAYGYYFDRALWRDVALLFAADGKLRLGPIRADGPDDIEKVVSEQMSSGRVPGADRLEIVHLIANPKITLDGDTATGDVMWTVVKRGSDGLPFVSAQGRHLDDYVRENGKWRIQRRRGFQDMP